MPPMKPKPKPTPKPRGNSTVAAKKAASQKAANKVYNTQGTIKAKERSIPNGIYGYGKIISKGFKMVPGTTENRQMTAQNKALDKAKADYLKAHKSYVNALKASKTPKPKPSPKTPSTSKKSSGVYRKSL